MIKVNLVGARRKKPSVGLKATKPANFTSVLSIFIVLGTGGGGYWWYSSLTAKLADLDSRKVQAEQQKAELDAVLKADQVYEARKKALEQRVKIVENLQTNQQSPVVALDQLADAIDRTHFVWLANLDQKDAILSMSGIGTSLNAIADFYSNLNATGYFKNVDQGTATQDAAGNWSFTLRCEFSPPRGLPSTASTPQPAEGGN